MESTRRLAAALLVAALAGPSAAEPDGAALRFVRGDSLVQRLTLESLRADCTAQRVEVDDPYYGRSKRFLACPLVEVLELGFGGPVEELVGHDFFLLARDGYARPASGEQLAEPGGWLAFADADLPEGWEPIDRRALDPGPFYVVWSGPDQSDPHRYPWPYQLDTVEIAPFESRYPHTLPRTAEPGSPARAGFRLFRRECVSCHAINGEGGKVGPDLNVPRSIVEYRPVAQIKAFIRDPASFRYTSMPAHTHLSPRQLDELIAYFETMSRLKRDPGAERE